MEENFFRSLEAEDLRLLNESLTSEEFVNLRVGETFLYFHHGRGLGGVPNTRLYKVLSRSSENEFQAKDLSPQGAGHTLTFEIEDAEGMSYPPPPEMEDMHIMSGYDEAKKKTPPGTFDGTEILRDNEKIKETDDRLTSSNAFDRAFTRPAPGWRPGMKPNEALWGEITATKTYTDPEKEKTFLSARLYMRISRRASVVPVLHIETDVYTVYNPEERIKRGRTWGHQIAKKDFPITAIPRSWPGVNSTLLNPSINPHIQQKVHWLFAETYKAFVNALVPPPPEIEDMHLLSGYDESFEGLSKEEFLDLKRDDEFYFTVPGYEKKLYKVNSLVDMSRIRSSNFRERPGDVELRATGPDGKEAHFNFFQRRQMQRALPPEIEDMHLLSGYDEALIVRLEKTVDDSEPFSMWSNTDKYVPVGSEEDRELLYGVEESATTIEAFLAVGKIMESVKPRAAE
jgi:hypothetical protein